jgi:hypothetical protein
MAKDSSHGISILIIKADIPMITFTVLLLKSGEFDKVFSVFLD